MEVGHRRGWGWEQMLSSDRVCCRKYGGLIAPPRFQKFGNPDLSRRTPSFRQRVGGRSKGFHIVFDSWVFGRFVFFPDFVSVVFGDQ